MIYNPVHHNLTQRGIETNLYRLLVSTIARSLHANAWTVEALYRIDYDEFCNS